MTPRRRATVAALVAAATAWLPAGCTGRTAATTPPAATASYDGTLRTHLYGVPGALSVSATLVADRALRIASGTLAMDGRRLRVMFAPWDGRDLDGPEDYGPLRVAAGTRVDMAAGDLPDCAARRHPPLVLDLTLVGGARRHYLLGSGDAYAAAAHRVCAAGVAGAVVASRQDVDGSFSVTIALANPGAAPATVASAAFTVGTTHWAAGSVVLPARGTGRIVLHGHGAEQMSGCRHETPWAAGRLTSGGRRVSIPRSQDAC